VGIVFDITTGSVALPDFKVHLRNNWKENDDEEYEDVEPGDPGA
jgi:hypothetical protein